MANQSTEGLFSSYGTYPNLNDGHDVAALLDERDREQKAQTPAKASDVLMKAAVKLEIDTANLTEYTPAAPQMKAGNRVEQPGDYNA